MDYMKQYDQETYIFDTVSSRFKAQGFLNAYDFFCIIIWKANRAKTKISKRLLEKGDFRSLDDAVLSLTSGIFKAVDHKERLRHVMQEWGFQLPMATAILTALYQDDFTVYDIRVCEELDDFYKLKNLIRFESIWIGYQEYKQTVEESEPKGLSLRDKDRFLWGRSFSKQLENDIKHGFSRALDSDEV